jgi:hypothetical protein
MITQAKPTQPSAKREQLKYKPVVIDNTLTPLRVYEGMLSRLKKMQEVEIKRNGYPISMADIMRKCISVGLTQWEQSQGGQRG